METTQNVHDDDEYEEDDEVDHPDENATHAEVDYENESDVENSDAAKTDEEEGEDQTSDESDGDDDMVTLPRSKIKKMQDDHEDLIERFEGLSKKLKSAIKVEQETPQKQKKKKTYHKTNTKESAIYISSDSDVTSQDCPDDEQENVLPIIPDIVKVKSMCPFFLPVYKTPYLHFSLQILLLTIPIRLCGQLMRFLCLKERRATRRRL